MTTLCSCWAPTKRVKLSNKLLLISELIKEEVVRKRVPQITAIKTGLEDVKLLQLFNQHSSLAKSLLNHTVYQDLRKILKNAIKSAQRKSNISKEKTDALVWLEEFVENDLYGIHYSFVCFVF